MIKLPQFHQIKTDDELQKFSSIYLKSSGLPIPDKYLYNPRNKIFGIYWEDILIGGFILGNNLEFRTIKVFANDNCHEVIYDKLKNKSDYTEITCFWIKRKFRTKTRLNLFIWLSMAYALKKYGSKYFLFGTCSRSLARLYGTTSKSILIHQDLIRKKPTYIFWAKRRTCVQGILEIVFYKLKRVFSLNTGSTIKANML